MKIAFTVAGIVALVAAAAGAFSISGTAGSACTVEESDAAAVPGALVMPEVVVRANQMPEVIVRASRAIEVAGLEKSGSEVLN